MDRSLLRLCWAPATGLFRSWILVTGPNPLKGIPTTEAMLWVSRFCQLLLKCTNGIYLSQTEPLFYRAYAAAGCPHCRQVETELKARTCPPHTALRNQRPFLQKWGFGNPCLYSLLCGKSETECVSVKLYEESCGQMQTRQVAANPRAMRLTRVDQLV